MTIETLLFPVGPVAFGDTEQCGVMVCRPGPAPVETIWAENWQAAYDEAIDLFALEDSWVTVPRMADRIEGGAGRDRQPNRAQVLKLARLVGDLADHDGFEALTSDTLAYALLRALGAFREAAQQLADQRSVPVILELDRDGITSMFACALGRDGAGAQLYLTQDPAMLRRLIETSFGLEAPEGLGFVTAQADRPEGWIADAMQDLFGTGFAPMIRTRRPESVTTPPSENDARFLTLALYRATDIAAGAQSATGAVTLHDGSWEVRMDRFDP